MQNFSTAIMLINPKVRAVLAIYEAHEENHQCPPKTMFKTLDQTLVAGDLAIVQTDTRHKATVVKITDVDVDVNYESTTIVNWVIGKYDPEPLKVLMQKEAEMGTMIRSAEKRKKRDELHAALLADNPGLADLAIATLDDPLKIIDANAETKKTA